MFKFRDSCSLISRALAEALNLQEEVLVGAAASAVPSRIVSCSSREVLSPLEVGVSFSIAGKSSMGNYLPHYSLGGSGSSWMMMASGHSTLLGGVIFGSLAGCSSFWRLVRAFQGEYTGGFLEVGRTVLKKLS